MKTRSEAQKSRSSKAKRPPIAHGNGAFEKHGLTTMKAVLRRLGDRALDGRTSTAKALAEWEGEVIADLGGPDMLTAQQRELLKVACRTKLMLSSIDAWILTQDHLVDRRKRALIPVVKERATLVNSLHDLLRSLGLERRARPVTTLSEILKSKEPAA